MSTTSVKVAPSAVLELFWLTLRCDGEAAPRAHPLFDSSIPRMARLAQRTRDFWGASREGFPELLSIAQHRGILIGESLEGFLAELPVSSLRTDDLTLKSESAEVRAMIIERLDRLRANANLRRRYLALLRDLWAAVRDEWESEGRPAVERGIEMVQRRLDAGEQPAELVPKVSEHALGLVRRPGDAQVLVCPGYFSGRCIWELSGVLVVGMTVDEEGGVAALRLRAEAIAPRLKALADPTRLAILLRVTGSPASITDVTREFGISQPAVSVHFRILREAGLVSGERVGGRTLYSGDQSSAAGLVDELSTALVPSPAAVLE